MAQAPASPPDPAAIMRSRQFVGLLVLAAIIGVIASFASWLFLEAVYEAQQGVYTDLPDALGFDHTPLWWSLPWLAFAGVVVAFAIARLPGRGGHIPANGLNAAPTQPIDLPGVMLAAIAGIGLGAVVGPEAPLIALGGGLGFFAIRRIRADAPPDLQAIVAACGTFAAISFLFGSPLIAAVLLIEAAGLGGAAAAAHPDPGSTGRRDRDADRDRPRLVDGSEHERDLARAPATARLRPSRRHRLPLDHPAGGRDRGRDRAHLPARASHRADRHAAALRRPAADRAGDVRPRDRLRRDHRQGSRPGAVLGPGRARAADRERRDLVARPRSRC